MSQSPDDSFSVRLNKAVQGQGENQPQTDAGAPRKPVEPPARTGDSFMARLEQRLEKRQSDAESTETEGPGQDTVQHEPCGAGDHVLQAEECLAGIADQHGHHWTTIWDAPANAQIREARQDPNLLLAGDRLHIPPNEAKHESAESEARHRFVLQPGPANLVLQLKDGEGQPRANLAYELECEGETRSGHTDPSGTLRETLPANARTAHLLLTDTGESYPLQVGTLQTAGACAGVQARLNNLGFNCGPVTGDWNEATRHALRAFQAKEGLKVDGFLDEATLQRLRNVHRS